MKKWIACLLAGLLLLGIAGCGEKSDAGAQQAAVAEGNGALSHEDYVASEYGVEVTVNCYVQGTCDWKYDEVAGEGRISVYAQDQDGGYFIYDLLCSEADARRLEPGTGICVTGIKVGAAGGEEIQEATFTFLEGEPYVAQPVDVTDLLAAENLTDYQYQIVSLEGMGVEAVAYQNEDKSGNIKLVLSKDGNFYTAWVMLGLVEETDTLYQAAGKLTPGDTVNLQGFLYWYEEMELHITGLETL